MSPDRNKNFNIREIGRRVKDFLLEPITFAKLLKERSDGMLMPEQMAVVAFPFMLGLVAGVNYGPVAGIAAGGATWLLEAAIFRTTRSHEQHIN